MPTYLYLKTKTTGKSPDDQPWEIAYILWDRESNQKRVVHHHVEHTATANQWVLDNTDYADRQGGLATVSRKHFAVELMRNIKEIDASQIVWVGAKPEFDEYYIRQMLTENGIQEVWSYRLQDISDRAGFAFGLAESPGIEKTAELLGVTRADDSRSALTTAQLVHDCHLVLAEIERVLMKLTPQIVDAYHSQRLVSPT